MNIWYSMFIYTYTPRYINNHKTYHWRTATQQNPAIQPPVWHPTPLRWGCPANLPGVSSWYVWGSQMCLEILILNCRYRPYQANKKTHLHWKDQEILILYYNFWELKSIKTAHRAHLLQVSTGQQLHAAAAAQCRQGRQEVRTSGSWAVSPKLQRKIGSTWSILHGLLIA